MSDEKFFTVSEAAKILDLTEYTVRKKIREGQINAVPGASDREGYKIPYDEVIRYAQANKHSDFTGVAAGILGGLGLGLGIGLPIMAIGFGISKLLDGIDDEKKNEADYKKIQDLSIESIKDEIQAIKFYIEALELEGENLSSESKKKILEGRARIKLLEREIKEIKLKHLIKNLEGENSNEGH